MLHVQVVFRCFMTYCSSLESGPGGQLASLSYSSITSTYSFWSNSKVPKSALSSIFQIYHISWLLAYNRICTSFHGSVKHTSCHCVALSILQRNLRRSYIPIGSTHGRLGVRIVLRPLRTSYLQIMRLSPAVPASNGAN